MKKFILFLFFLLVSSSIAFAQVLPQEPESPKESFTRAKVIAITHTEIKTIDGYQSQNQTIKLQLLQDPNKGKIITTSKATNLKLAQSQTIAVGQEVILDVITQSNQPTQYTITDTYRLPQLFYLCIIFFIFTIFFTGKKGFGAIVGLILSLYIIMEFIIPQMLNHHDPLFVSVIGAMIILVTTTYLAHGFSKQTTIAVVSTFLSLAATVAFSLLAVKFANLAGLGTEDSYLLDINPTQSINPQGLLLSGIIIGTLGALNDITTTQVTAIYTLFQHNNKLSFINLALQGFLIGREHIVSLVNTLVLAYAGSSLVIFIFFALNPAHLPWWVIVNNESVSEEVVRTIAGSFGLVLAVPIATFLASFFAIRQNLN